MNQAFSINCVRSVMLTGHPKGDVQEVVEKTCMTLRRGDKLKAKTSKSSAYHGHLIR